MKFKCNKGITFVWSIILMFGCIFPGMLIYSFFNKSEDKYFSLIDLFYLFLVLVIIIIITNIISLIISLKDNDYVLINEDYFVYKEKSVNYLEIKYIKYNFGETPRHTRWTKASINFYDDNEDLFFFIDNPSFIMSIILIIKCKNAKFKIIDLSKYLIMMFIFLLIGIILCFIK